jgi:catechol 2,3-dioxygenase-like lactoylglutathione lyase family enzyme
MLAALLLAAGAATAPGVGPWTEAVVSVRDLARSSALFTQVGGWRVVARGRVTRSELAYWALPAGATGTFLKICAPAADTGCIRFVRFAGVAQQLVRPPSRAWDTGGIYSLMVRSSDVQALYEKALALGWWAESEPIAFRFGGSDLRNVVLQGPDGFQLAVYERKSPPFTAFPVGLISQAFNSMRMVRDQRASVAFYRRLGFKPVFDSDYVDPAPTPNNFSLPQNLTPTVIRRASALQPVEGETGRVEVMQFVGLSGRDFSDRARAPNLGILSLRYPTGLASAQAGATVVESGGLGRIALTKRTDPDGNLTEFYEAVK